jgi:hypothetical protein
MPRLVSGGAHGADECFEQCATTKGHKISVFSFKEHSVVADPSNVVEMSHYDLEHYASRLAHVGEMISKNVPSAGYTRWLLLRNIVVATKADCMFAVISAMLKPPKGTFIGVPGGTGWTTQCFAMEYLNHQQIIKQKIKIPLWVFDGTNKWHQLVCRFGNLSWEILPDGKVPQIKEHYVYAGVGSREFSTCQRQAIQSLFSL